MTLDNMSRIKKYNNYDYSTIDDYSYIQCGNICQVSITDKAVRIYNFGIDDIYDGSLPNLSNVSRKILPLLINTPRFNATTFHCYPNNGDNTDICIELPSLYVLRKYYYKIEKCSTDYNLNKSRY